MDLIKYITVTKENDATVKITGEVPFAELNKHRSRAVAELGKEVKIDGFRQGHVPEAKLVEKIGELSILSEMARLTLAEIYPELIKQHELSVIGRPQLSITKLAKNNPLGFSATVAVLPEVKLPNYKNIASGVNKDKESVAVAVTDAEVDKQIENILRQKVAYERIQKQATAKQKAETKSDDFGSATELPTPESEGTKTEAADDGEPELPKLNDEYVKSLGEPEQFNTVAEFKKVVHEGLKEEKKRLLSQKKRARLTDAIIEQTNVTVPQILIDSEVSQLFEQLQEDLSRAGLKLPDYLSHLKKTEADLKQEWREPAAKRAKLQLILNEIVKQEKIELDEATLKAEVSRLMEQYQDADEANVRVYVASIMRNEQAMELLEKQ